MTRYLYEVNIEMVEPLMIEVEAVGCREAEKKVESILDGYDIPFRYSYSEREVDMSDITTHIDDATSLELEVYEPDDTYVNNDMRVIFEKDESGKWWVISIDDEDERGPFNSLEHACEVMAHIHEGR